MIASSAIVSKFAVRIPRQYLRLELLKHLEAVGRVTPCAPGFVDCGNSANRVTRPALMLKNILFMVVSSASPARVPASNPPRVFCGGQAGRQERSGGRL